MSHLFLKIGNKNYPKFYQEKHYPKFGFEDKELRNVLKMFWVLPGLQLQSPLSDLSGAVTHWSVEANCIYSHGDAEKSHSSDAYWPIVIPGWTLSTKGFDMVWCFQATFEIPSEIIECWSLRSRWAPGIKTFWLDTAVSSRPEDTHDASKKNNDTNGPMAIF